ncbi:hypothetical protein M3E11_009390 [Micrococcus luteus]|uniref:hypothetical protein n=1 Tax=Micrococcus luteus TaxID=1270 RepID=UPI00215063B9|nr:hypothetical protein [Micrococcus luteus]MCR4488869.1 hypothetical protein [Micrococcus luteus]MCV7505164.1 hypothetical protein [Micrococcus luteus]MCV7518798.1 hypothetical protein [Micrococcus luteus]MCV7568113.1 hypothetical protein [Micrococcus luteus]
MTPAQDPAERTARMAAALAPGDVVVAVGSDTSDDALHLACAAGAHVLAVIPDPRRAADIERSARRRDVHDRIEVHTCAVGALPDQPTRDVPGRTVDGLVGRRVVRMLAIDGDGLGAEVLEGARDTLCRGRPLVWIDCPHERAYQAVAAVLGPLGYRVLDVQDCSPTLLFAPTAPGIGPVDDPGVDAALRRLYAERRAVDALRARLRCEGADTTGVVGLHGTGISEIEAGAPGDVAGLRAELAAARRRVEEFEARAHRDREDFRVLRGFVEDVQQRLWEERQARAARESAGERLREVEEALGRVAEEKERAAAMVREARSALRRVRSSRSYRVGRVLGDARTLQGARRALPRLVSIIRQHRKDDA